MPDRMKEDAQILNWRRPTEILLSIVIVFAISLGGAPSDANWQILGICFLAAILIPVSFSAGAGDRFASLPLLVRMSAIAILLLPLMQLVPLPPVVWQSIPGRELASEIFALVGTGSTWRGLSLVPRDTLFGFLMILPAAAVFLATLTLDRKARGRVVWTLLALVAVSLVLGLIQFGTKGATLDIYGTAHRGSLLGFFANRNHQGLLMAIGGTFAIAAVKYHMRNAQAAVATAALVSMVFFIAAVGTLSRAGIGLTVLALGATFYACFIHGRLRWPLVAGGALLASISLYFVTFSSTVQSALDRFSQIEENGRQEIWQKTSPLIEQYLPWGAGLGSFTSVYPVIEHLEDVNPYYFNRVHNEYLELLIEFGWPGLIVLLLFIFIFSIRVLRWLRGDDKLGVFALPAAISILLIGLHSFVDYPLRTQAHSVIFALACGLLFVRSQRQTLNEDNQIAARSWNDRSTRFAMLGISGQAIIIIAFVLFVNYQKGNRATFEHTGVSLVNAESESMPASQLAAAKRALSRQPYDQPLLNSIYVSEVREGMDETQRAAFVSALNKLGWRDTETQQNLLFEAARQNDLEAALNHMDALLRRGKLTNQIMPLLAQLELDPDGVELLADRLDQDPGWRGSYFDFADPLQNSLHLDARLRLFDYMQAQGMPIRRIEQRVTLYALVRAERRNEVAQIGLAQLPSDKKSQLLFDPEFSQLSNVPEKERSLATPLDWRLTNRSGISAQIISEEWSSRLAMRWNGRGAPIIARTMTFLTEGQQPELEVSLNAGSQLRSLDSLRFTLVCSGVREVLFVRKAAGSAASPGLDRRTAYYAAEDKAPCDYPDLYIGGRPRSGDRGASLSIDSVKLSAL